MPFSCHDFQDDKISVATYDTISEAFLSKLASAFISDPRNKQTDQFRVYTETCRLKKNVEQILETIINCVLPNWIQQADHII